MSARAQQGPSQAAPCRVSQLCQVDGVLQISSAAVRVADAAHVEMTELTMRRRVHMLRPAPAVFRMAPHLQVHIMDLYMQQQMRTAIAAASTEARRWLRSGSTLQAQVPQVSATQLWQYAFLLSSLSLCLCHCAS